MRFQISNLGISEFRIADFRFDVLKIDIAIKVDKQKKPAKLFQLGRLFDLVCAEFV